MGQGSVTGRVLCRVTLVLSYMVSLEIVYYELRELWQEVEELEYLYSTHICHSLGTKKVRGC